MEEEASAEVLGGLMARRTWWRTICLKMDISYRFLQVLWWLWPENLCILLYLFSSLASQLLVYLETLFFLLLPVGSPLLPSSLVCLCCLLNMLYWCWYALNVLIPWMLGYSEILYFCCLELPWVSYASECWFFYAQWWRNSEGSWFYPVLPYWVNDGWCLVLLEWFWPLTGWHSTSFRLSTVLKRVCGFDILVYRQDFGLVPV